MLRLCSKGMVRKVTWSMKMLCRVTMSEMNRIMLKENVVRRVRIAESRLHCTRMVRSVIMSG